MITQLLWQIEWTWIATVLIGSLVYFVVSSILRRKSLPPGPTPLPILGNLLELRGDARLDNKVKEWRSKYGDIFTIWLGLDPTVIVTDWEITKDALITMKNNFSGRPLRYTNAVFQNGHDDVVASDLGPAWETLRKLFSLAVRKYSVSENLPLLINDVVNQTISLMLDKKGPFEPKEYLYFTIYNIIASTAFGKRYTIDDDEFQDLKNANENVSSELGFGTILDIYPILRHVYRRKDKRIRNLVATFNGAINKEYVKHRQTYQKGVIRDFTDACLAAKEEAELEDYNTAQYFTDGNMVNVINDLFSAGTETTRLALTWTLLYLISQPEVQEKVREEILTNIGDSIPVQEDRHKCPYTQAVITETLRLRPIVTFSLEHKASVNAKLAGYEIPKDTSMVFHFLSQHMDPKIFKDPEVFRPERFLEEDGSFMTTTRFTNYLPFGLGRRACPGEKLAKADIFLVLAGFLQKVRFSLPKGAKVDFEPINVVAINLPKPFKIIVEKI